MNTSYINYRLTLTAVLFYFILHVSAGSIFSIQEKSRKAYNSYKNLVMVGYQGWFNTPEDGAGRRWAQYQNYKTRKFEPGECSIDLWPDVTDYKQTYETPFLYEDGTHARVFSSNDESTVELHFKWMRDYKIDGAFMQRFVINIKNYSNKCHFDKVLDSANKYANKYSRAISIFYDLTGMQPGDGRILLNDIDSITERYSILKHKENPSYLYHNGKPLVVVWGIGFKNRKYTLLECDSIVNSLKKRGFSIMVGVPTRWRDLSGDAVADSLLHRIIKSADIVSPWRVGRYNFKNYNSFKETIMKKDLEWANQYGIGYAPVCFPGFSWRNMNKYPDERSLYPRNGGRFYWEQLSSAIEMGVKMIYIAMFDEINEGTAIFKCSEKVPLSTDGSIFIPVDRPSDFYLWLTGQASMMIKQKKKLEKNLPKR